MKNTLNKTSAGILAILGIPLLLGSVLVRPAGADGEAVFEMREVAVFESTQSQELARGQYAQCETEPDEKVKVYPKLKSKRPLYGVIKFARDPYEPESGVEYRFVVDESGDAAPTDVPPAKESSLLETLSDALRGSSNTRSKPKPTPLENTYDRLYFDLNRDLDLTNDPVLQPAKNPPSGAIPSWDAKQKVVFEDLALALDFGAEIGTRPFPVLPRLIVSEYEAEDYGTLYFIAKTARQGRIRIGPTEYDAVLGQRYLVTGRFDLPSTTMLLTSTEGRSQREWWWGADELCAMREVDGKYYTASTTPLGDKLIVKPYEGDVGVLKTGPGGRDIEDFKVRGSIRSKKTALAVGTRTVDQGDYEAVQECRLPVGDYLASYLTFDFGGLRIGVSDNYHSDGTPRDTERTRLYNIKIRKDRPFVLDFSHKPEVMFASPAKDQAFKPDEEIEVKAVLTDPALDIMIRDLDDTTRTQEESTNVPGGGERTITRQLSLDPMVTITNSSGKVVSEGKMPFG